MTTPQFWHVNYQVELAGGSYGIGDIARDEQEARLRAASRSREHGHANIFTNTGIFATYVNGVEQK